MINTRDISTFFCEGVWALDVRRLNPLARFSVRALRRLMMTGECFAQNKLYSYAAALTYNCILAAVPILSIIFAIARGFGFGSVIEARIKENISASDGIANEVFSFINHYLEHTHSGVFLGVGLLLLLYTVIMLTSNIETAFNTIWHVRSSRNIYRQILNYASIFLLFPLLIVVTSGFSVFMLTIVAELRDYQLLSHTMSFVIKYTPLLLSCLCFVALYKFMPNTHVRWRAVALPGFLAGCLFQVLQYFYIHYQLMLSSYNAIYGSFAALPLFMLWMQFSWYICLGGAQMSYALQHAYDYVFSKNSGNLSRCEHDTLCLLLMSQVCRRFQEGGTAHDTASLVEATELPQSTVQGLLDELTLTGLLCETRQERSSATFYQPSLDINRITVQYVLERIDNRDQGHISAVWKDSCPAWDQALAIRESARLEGGDTPVASLCHCGREGRDARGQTQTIAKTNANNSEDKTT